MTTQQRIQLALAAVEGLSDAELSKRGTGGFKAMIERKRAYAQAARLNYAAAEAMTKQLVALKDSMDTIEQLDKPIEDVSEAAALLAGLSKQSNGE